MNTVSPSRAAAFAVLLRVEREQAYAQELLHSQLLEKLSAADRALATEIVMGVLRWRMRLDSAIREFSFTPFHRLDVEVLTAMRVGAYQLMFLERVPARAAVNESVQLVKASRKASAAGMANVVLRKIAAQEKQRTVFTGADFAHGTQLTPELLAHTFSHPVWLVERWVREYGAASAQAICDWDQHVPATHIRLRGNATAAEHELRDNGVDLAIGALLRDARRAFGDVAATTAWSEAHVVIQDEGSQLVAALVGNGTRILDCCAAPGGKTQAIADRNPTAAIVAAEIHEHRVRLMRKLVRASNVEIICADATALPVTGEFDRILADVPCSGTGTLARNPEIKWRLRAEDITRLHAEQVAILRAALGRLARGGRLVYSSCSLEREENEDVVEEALQAGAEVRVLDVRHELDRLRTSGDLVWNDVATLTRGPYLRTLPGVHPCDGFFAAIVERQ